MGFAKFDEAGAFGITRHIAFNGYGTQGIFGTVEGAHEVLHRFLTSLGGIVPQRKSDGGVAETPEPFHFSNAAMQNHVYADRIGHAKRK